MESTHLIKNLKLDSPSQSLASKVAQRLKGAIVDGQFKLGEMIPEETLANGFGVSRTPVREALNQLQLLGLVVIRPQRGSYVFEPTEDDISDICEFRCVVEPKAAELAYAHDRQETILTLQRAIEEMEQAMRDRDSVRYGRADTQLHEAFFLHCGNPYLQTAYETAAAKIATLRTHLSAPADVLHPRGFQQHSKMLKLFSEGDFDAFEKLMKVHVTGTRDNYLRSLKLGLA
jgi:DNA-binding GntR family transcriptional regulator